MQIKPNYPQEVILALIKAEMKNIKLISGLNEAGVLVEDFYTDLGTTILKLIGFEDSDRDDDLYNFYDSTLDRLIDYEVNRFEERLPRLALELYNELLRKKVEIMEMKLNEHM